MAFYAYAQSPASTSSKHAASVSPRVREGTFLAAHEKFSTSPEASLEVASWEEVVRNRYQPLLLQTFTNRSEEKSGSMSRIQKRSRALFRTSHEIPLERSNTSSARTPGLVYARNPNRVYSSCAKNLTMGESYQEFFVDHADVFELSRTNGTFA